MRNILFTILGYTLLLVFFVIAIFLPKDYSELKAEEQEALETIL